MNYKEQPLAGLLPISLITKICSYVLNKNFPTMLHNNDVLKLRLSCRLFGHLSPETGWWEQIYTFLDPNTCTFYCYKILDVFLSSSHDNRMPAVYQAPQYSLSSCHSLHNPALLAYSSRIFGMLSQKLRPSVKISLLRFIAINNYKYQKAFGVLFFQYLLETHVDTKKTTQLVNTLQSLEDQVFYKMYNCFQISLTTSS